MNGAPLLLISLCVGSALLLAGGVLWVMGGKIAPRTDLQEPRPEGSRIGRLIALIFAWIGSFSQCWLAFMMFGVSLDLSEFKDALASILLIAGFLNSLIVGGMTLHWLRLGTSAEDSGVTAQHRVFLIGYSVVVATTFLANATVFWLAFIGNRHFLNDDSAGLLFASLGALITGWTAVAFCDPPRTPASVGRVPLHRNSGLLLRCIALILIVWGVICWSWLAIIPGGIWLLVIWTTLSARNRAGELTVLWSLSISSRNGSLQGPNIWQHMSRVQGPAQRRLKRLAVVLGDGEPLDLALQRCRVIPRSCSMEVQAALDADRLSEALKAAAARETKRFAQGPEVTESFSISYFALIINIIIFIVGFLMYYIIPKFKKIFEDFGTELPHITKLLIHLSDGFVNYWYIFVPIILPLSFFAATSDMHARFYGWRSLFEQYLGSYWPRLRSPDLLRGLAWGIRGDRPLAESLAAMTLGQASLPVRHRIRYIAEQVRNGEDVWDALEEQGWVNAAEREALQRAQALGNLPWVLETLADTEEQRWECRMAYRLQFVRPTMIILLGVAVGFIAIGFFMPLVKLLNDLS